MKAKKAPKKASTTAAMTREQILKQMGIKDEDFRDYLNKHTTFLKSLNANQKKFHHQNTPKKKVADVAKSLGPGVEADHVTKLFKEAPPMQGLMSVSCCKSR